MPTGQPTFIQDPHTFTAQITPVGQLKTNEVFDTLKPSYHESMTAASGGTRLAPIQVGKLLIQSLSGNGIMYVGGVDTDAPFSGRGIILYSSDINPIPLELPISNANSVSVCATVSGQLISYWGFINASNTILDPARQGVAPDIEPPKLLSSIPYSGAGNIPLTDVTLYGYFNEALDPASINASSFILRNSGTSENEQISGTRVLFTNIAAFQPASGQLAYGSFYTQYYTPVVTDVVGNHMLNSASFVFATAGAPDLSGPIFLSSDPVDLATNVITNNQTVNAYFNEFLDPNSINQSSVIVRQSGAAESTMVSGTASINFDQITANLQINSGQLGFTKWYNAFVTPLLTDTAGNPTISATFAFQTAAAPDTAGPIYMSSNPVSGSTGISTNGVTFYSYFNEAILDTSIDLSSYMLRNSGSAASTKVSGVMQVSPGNPKIAQFVPESGQLAVSAWYNAFLTLGITDLNSNTMTVSGKFAFLTAGPLPVAAPVVQSSVPVSGSTGFDISSNLTVTMNQLCSGNLTSMAPVISIITLSGTVFPGTTTFDNVGQQLFTFDPTSTLLYSQGQSIRVSGIYNTSSIVMAPVNIPFTTMARPNPPAVVSTTPASGSTGADISGNVTVVMDITCSGTTTSMAQVIRIVDSSANVFNGTVTFDNVGKKTFTFDPTLAQNYLQVQNIKVSGIYDTIGGVMTPVSIPFTSMAPIAPPVIVSTSPASGSSNFSISDNLTVTMDKIVSGTTSSMAPVVSVIDISGNVFNGTVTFDSVGKKVFTFNPTNDLRYSYAQTMRVSGIIDVNGNYMVPVNVPFTTADPAMNSITLTSPTISNQALNDTFYILAEKRDSSSSQLDGLTIRQVKVYLKKTGTPNTTVKVVLRQNIESSDTNHVTIGTMPSTSLTTSFVQYTFTNLSNTYALTTNDAVGVWADNAALSSSNTIGVQTGADSYDGGNSFFVKGHGGSYDDVTAQDLAATFYY